MLDCGRREARWLVKCAFNEVRVLTRTHGRLELQKRTHIDAAVLVDPERFLRNSDAAAFAEVTDHMFIFFALCQHGMRIIILSANAEQILVTGLSLSGM